MIEPILLTFDVACPADHAFDVWTRRIAAWWPVDHSVSGEPDLAVVLEPRVGGRIFERLPSGIEHDWGEVTTWEPPARLGYLWHLRRDRADATDRVVRPPTPSGRARASGPAPRRRPARTRRSRRAASRTRPAVSRGTPPRAAGRMG